MEVILDNQKIKKLIFTLSEKKLAGWDGGFVESVQDYFEKYNKLSEKQISILLKIKEKFSPENEIARELWTVEYKEKHIKNAKVLADYYTDTGYFVNLSRDILHDVNFVPSKKQWKTISENKYAKKVLVTYNQVPMFEIGGLVCLRSTRVMKRMMKRKNLVSNAAIVLEYLPEIFSHAKGAKRLRLLPIGSTDPIILEERQLKSFRKMK